jgi:predicted Zn-ribbon and HTH transcriptional regulator
MKRETHRNDTKTIRQHIADLLNENDMSARELSQALGIREKEVFYHISHIARTVKAQGKKLIILPSQCLSCGYVFEDRKRFTPPGKCPYCKKSHLKDPAFKIR